MKESAISISFPFIIGKLQVCESFIARKYSDHKQLHMISFRARLPNTYFPRALSPSRSLTGISEIQLAFLKTACAAFLRLAAEPNFTKAARKELVKG